MRRSRLNRSEEEEEQAEEEEMEGVGEGEKGGTSSRYRGDLDRGRERQTGCGGGGKGRGRGGNEERESGGSSGGARDAVSSGFQSCGSSQEPSDSVPEVSETDALSAARGGGKKKELMEAVREHPLTDLERMIEQDALGGEICWGMGWVFSSASPAPVYC